MVYTENEIDEYINEHIDIESTILQKIRMETFLNIPMSGMLSSHIQGRALSVFSKMIKPNTILEVGTFTGYSAICLSEGLQSGGVLHTIDKNTDLELTVRNYFELAGVSSRINYHIGMANEIIPRISEMFDLVFIDADKKNNSLYYDLVFDKVNPGGFIIIDNVLWKGKVLEKEHGAKDKITKYIVEFNKKVRNDNRIEKTILPIRDGLMLVRKI